MKTAIVTGSRRGIGLGIARKLAENGWRAVLSAASPAERAQEALESLTSAGCNAVYIRCDIADPAQREALLQETVHRFGRIDLLVNNAGIAPQKRMDLLETSEVSLERVLAVNLKGTFFLCQAAARHMIALKAQMGGDYCPRIVNISSISAYTASVNRGEYCISKAGVSMVTQLFADRLAEYNIPVFEVRPGIILTDMIAPVKQKYEALIAGGLLPLRRLGTPEDVADCVLAAASGLLDYATGQVLNADGGFHIRRL